tara:strand:- start:683 stop:937 length:255 start_codon:yes stop_codon:yes gene_type:complete
MTVIDWCPRYFKLRLNDDVTISVSNCLNGEGYESTVIIFDPHETNILLATKTFSSGKKHATEEEAEAELFNAIGQLLMKQLMGE